MTAIYESARSFTGYRPDLQTYGRDEDEQGLEDLDILGKQVQPKVDKDEIFRQLGEHGKHVLCRLLRSARHGMVGIMFECNSTKQEGYDSCHQPKPLSPLE